MKDKKRYEKFLDALLGVAYSYTAIAAGLAVLEDNPKGWSQVIYTLIAIYIIVKQYDKE